jgi:hypothetical protein
VAGWRTGTAGQEEEGGACATREGVGASPDARHACPRPKRASLAIWLKLLPLFSLASSRRRTRSSLVPWRGGGAARRASPPLPGSPLPKLRCGCACARAQTSGGRLYVGLNGVGRHIRQMVPPVDPVIP